MFASSRDEPRSLMINCKPFKVSKILSHVQSYVLFHFSCAFFERKILKLWKFFRAMAEIWKYPNFKNHVELNIFGQRIYIFGSINDYPLIVLPMIVAWDHLQILNSTIVLGISETTDSNYLKSIFIWCNFLPLYTARYR